MHEDPSSERHEERDPFSEVVDEAEEAQAIERLRKKNRLRILVPLGFVILLSWLLSYMKPTVVPESVGPVEVNQSDR